MLQLLRDSIDRNLVLVDESFQRDLDWFNTFLVRYNGVTFYDNQLIEETVFLDAYLQGLGVTFNKMVYALPLP